MISLPAPVRRVDFALIDRVFAPVAHWVRDWFDVRARSLSRASLVLLAFVPRFSDHPADEQLLEGAIVIIPLAIDFFAMAAPPTVGCANPRRHIEQVARFWFVLATPYVGATDGLSGFVFMLGNIAWLYFGAVDERPRHRRRASAPAVGGAS